MNAVLEDIKKKAIPILLEAGITRSGIFGSQVRGRARKDSDIDFLVEFPPKTSLFDIVELQEKLEKVLNKKVDLVDYKTIKPRIKDRILSEQIGILGDNPPMPLLKDEDREITRNPLVYVDDVIESINRIETYIKDLKQVHFLENQVISEAVLYRLTVIGEAVNNIPDAIQEKNPMIPWRKVIGMRNILIHDYRKTNLKWVWNVIKHDLPEFKKQIEEINWKKDLNKLQTKVATHLKAQDIKPLSDEQLDKAIDEEASNAVTNF